MLFNILVSIILLSIKAGDNVFYGRKKELAKLEKEYRKENSFCSIYGIKKLKKLL